MKFSTGLMHSMFLVLQNCFHQYYSVTQVTLALVRSYYEVIDVLGGCFTKTKIEFKLDLTMAGRLVRATGCSHHYDLYIIFFHFNNELSKKCKFCRIATMIYTSLEGPMPVNGKSKQWHGQPAIVKSNLRLILVFEKHSPALYKETLDLDLLPSSN